MSESSRSANVINTTREHFDTDVIQRSKLVPVVVDFWAQWCAPCRLLGPVLEALAEEYEGRFMLVKVNTEEAPDIAAAFQVQSIPAVFGIIDGQVKDAFTGALPEPQIREWLNRLLNAGLLAEAAALEENHPAEAETKYRELLVHEAENASALIGLARVLLKQSREDESREIIQKLEQRGFLEAEAEKVKAALALRSKGEINLDQRRRAAEANPGDLQAQLELAEALAGAGQHAQALDICLELIERDRQGVGESARTFMIELLRALPDDSPLVSEYRRKLAMLLY